MVELITSGDIQVLATQRASLSFAWTGDRWTHSLEQGGRSLARPVEIEPSEENPLRVVSPAYQQINFQDGPGGSKQALLVGQSGPHHFSAVFTMSDDGVETVVEVDMADRTRSPIEILASTYTVFLNSSDLIDADDRSICWDLAGSRLTIEGVSPSSTSLAEAGRGATRAQILAAIDPTRQTQRCIYRWRLS